MSPARSARIRAAFDQARDYDAHAQVQAGTAKHLAGLILGQGLGFGARVLDMGCGTGALAEHLLASGRVSRYLCADIALAMLGRARTKLIAAPIRPSFAAMDAMFPALKPGFDLVASNMALHWTSNLGASLAGLWELVLPGGWLAVAIPGNDTFTTWRQAHERLGLCCGLQDFPSAAAFAGLFPVKPLLLEEETHVLEFARALDLPRHLKAVGGYVPRSGHTPLTPGQFRAVLAELDRTQAQLGYHVLYGLALKPGLC